MSFFGTLRRIKGKRGPDEREMPSKNVIFNSTPNLHKIENKDKLTELPLTASGSSVTSVRSHSPGMNRPSPSPHVNRKLSTEPPSANSTPGTPKRRGSFGISSPAGNIRHFVSMMSMVNSLKRSTSSRKLAFGSAMHLNTKEGGEREEKTMIKKSSSKSEEKLCHKFEMTLKNLEPGVTSSSSSSISSDLGSLSGGRGSIRNSSERTDIPEEESDDELEKTPEEIEKETFILQGIKKFNMDPKKGVQFLVSKELIQNTAESIAQFLKVGEGLSKTAIGNYLGERIDFNEDVLRAFVELHDFTNVILVQALRQFLWSFRLPGEAQKIDRMMEAFAKRYCQLNPGIFSNTDTCYVLSYAIIMLNTTLHNRNVKDKPTVEQFIRMNRDIDGGKALNTDFIASLYNSIQSEPFKIPPEDGNDLMLTFFNPNIEGWLWKQGGRYKSWKRRWFILSNNCLYYFKFTADKTPRGIIPLENIIVKAEKSGKPFAFCLVKESLYSHTEYIKTCKTLSDGTIAPGQYSSIHLAAFNQKEREKWIKTISNNNSLSQFYSDLTLKKRKAEEKSKHKHVDKKDKLGVRKSQISLPSTVASVENHIILPDEIYADPRKNPHNFFVEKNVRPVIQHYDDTDSLNLEQEHHRNDRDLGLGSSVGSFDISQSASLKSDENYDCDSVSFDLNTSGAHFEDDVDKALESNLSRNTSICESDDERLVPEPNYCRPDFKRLSRIEESYRNSSLLDSPPVSKAETFVSSFTLLKEISSLDDSDYSHIPSPTIQDIKIVNYEEDKSTEPEETTSVWKGKESFDSTESTEFYYVVENSGSVNLTQRSNNNCVLGRTRLKSPPFTSKEILMECDTAMTPISGQPLGLVVSGAETPDGIETADDSNQVRSKASDDHEDSLHLTDLTTQYESSV